MKAIGFCSQFPSRYYILLSYPLQGLGLAKQLAEKVNNKLNYTPVEPEKEEETTSSDDRYEDEIEINSFPQQARWKITSKVRPLLHRPKCQGTLLSDARNRV